MQSLEKIECVYLITILIHNTRETFSSQSFSSKIQLQRLGLQIFILFYQAFKTLNFFSVPHFLIVSVS
jgi:hypothetical protein